MSLFNRKNKEEKTPACACNAGVNANIKVSHLRP